jgi:hypothetical protein
MTSAPHHPNFGQWAAIAYFLAGLRRSAPALAGKTAAAPGVQAKRDNGAAAGLTAAGLLTLPDGNHGDINYRALL